MNRGPLIFVGLFIILAISWAWTLDYPSASIGQLQPQGSSVDRMPRELTGQAQQGREVYQALGCIACHTQQVRFSSGLDIERGWGDRQSVARDYLDQSPSLLGNQRIGPDLTNVGARRSDEAWFLTHLYNPQIHSPGSNMPSYGFLFETRPIVGEDSNRALSLPEEYAPEAGYEVVPSSDAEALAAYMISLNLDYDILEAPSPEKVTLP